MLNLLYCLRAGYTTPEALSQRLVSGVAYLIVMVMVMTMVWHIFIVLVARFSSASSSGSCVFFGGSTFDAQKISKNGCYNTAAEQQQPLWFTTRYVVTACLKIK